MKPRSERLAPDGSPRYIRVYDNRGRSFDRYTVVFTGRYRHRTGEFLYLGMSADPFWPQGFGQHGSSQTQIDVRTGWPPMIGRTCHLGLRIRFEDLPFDCQRAVWNDYADLWKISVPNRWRSKAGA